MTASDKITKALRDVLAEWWAREAIGQRLGVCDAAGRQYAYTHADRILSVITPAIVLLLTELQRRIDDLEERNRDAEN